MSLIKALITPVTPFQQNAPILFCEDSKKCAFVDPGGDLDTLLSVAKDNDLILSNLTPLKHFFVKNIIVRNYCGKSYG